MLNTWYEIAAVNQSVVTSAIAAEKARIFPRVIYLFIF